MNTNLKIWIIATALLLFAVAIGTITKPYYVDAYFDRQPVTTLQASFYNATVNNLFGKTEVIEAEVILNKNATETLLHDSTGNWSFDITDQLNCVPAPNRIYKLAGAWNPVSSGNPLIPYKYKFFIVWVVGGC